MAARKKKRPTKSAKSTKAKKSEQTKRKQASGGSTGSRSTKAPTKGARRRSAGSSAGKLTPQQKAAATRKAKAAAAEAKRARKSERQRQRRAEQRDAELRAREELTRETDERDEAIGWLEAMTPEGFSLEMVEAEVAAANYTPWLAVGKFSPNGRAGYADLFDVFIAWANDIALETAINPQRISSIRIVYQDPSDQRGSGDSVVSHSGPWELVVSEMAGEVNPALPDSLASRYADSIVPHFYVYFAGQVARGAHWFPHYQRDASDE